ncbi:MAG: HAMP domain-containing histidine kinase [Bryobacterales bacterium]|nr:HAMP domain-containing histidine kinase [Bryobacterales bacterium]
MVRHIVLRTVGSALLFAAALLAASPLFAGQPSAWHWIALALFLAMLSALGWAPWPWRLSKAIARLEQSAARIAAGRLEERIPAAGAGELAAVALSIQQITQRFDGLLKGQKRFLGDVAHELNAPIARIQFALGVLEETIAEEHQADVKALHDEIQEMSALVNELSSYSKVGFAEGSAPLSAVNLRSAAQRASERENIPVQLSVPHGLTALANEVYLTRALANLLRNARRYAGENGPIEVRAERRRDEVELVVADRGPGLPDSELEHVFEPFYRLDLSRSTSSGGKGLGLAIVKSCVQACRGEVSCRNRKPSGLEVVIRLTPGVHAGQP